MYSCQLAHSGTVVLSVCRIAERFPMRSETSTNSRVDITVAIVQLECHPAFRIGTASYSSEPFVDDDQRPCLQELWDHRFPVEELQLYCRDRYFIWHRARLNSVVDWLAQLNTKESSDKSTDSPDVVVFPEGSIPRKFLSCLHRKLNPSVRKGHDNKPNGPIIFAGTHAFDHSPEAWEDYDKLGINREALATLANLNLETVSVMPVLYPDGKVELFPKLLLSPFERTAIGLRVRESPPASRIVEATLARLPNQTIRIQAFVCSEALQYTGVKAAEAPDLAVILSYDRNPHRFLPLVEHYSANQIPVVYCNDGAYGGSSIHCPPDNRSENWLLQPPRLGQLPKGDGIAVIGVALRSNAPDIGVNNPRTSHSLLRLSSIVPENSSLTTWRISAGIEDSRRSIQRNIKNCQPVDTRNLAVSLTHLLESESPTPVQRLQLERLLAMSRDGAASLREWKVFADDCRITQEHYRRSHEVLSRFNVVTLNESAGRSKGISYIPPSLALLESDLAAYCFHRISLLLDISESTELSVLLKARQRLAHKVEERLRGSAPEAVASLFHRIRRDAARTARVRLTNQLGRIVEQFQATSGMLFIVQPDGKETTSTRLVAQIMLNTPIREIERFADLKSQGIVGRVAAAQEPYLNSWVSSEELRSDAFFDPYYRETIPSTRAEVAVPVMAPTIDGKDTELIGVLNLESRIAGAFSALRIPQIEASATCMAMDIRVLQAIADRKRTLVWHPEIHGWGTKRILEQICYEIATSYSGSDYPPTISATIWYADTDKEKFYVRGTSRYDFEYIADAFLNTDSFLGYAYRKCEYGDVLRGAIDDLPSFRRRRKAERMELARAAVARFETRRQIETTERSSDGILALYSFRHELGANEADFDIAFTDSRVRTLASQIGAALGDFLELRLQAALALLRERLSDSSVIGIDDFDCIRDFLCEVFEADAATCFVNQSGHLKVVSTTGLEQSRKEYSVSNSEESCVNEECKRHGFTKYLSARPNRVLRKIDIPNEEERCIDTFTREPFWISPENLRRETGAVSRADHRRFLGASFGQDGGVAGVIRLIRSESSKPFVQSDEELLSSVIRVCEPAFAAEAERLGTRNKFNPFRKDIERLAAITTDSSERCPPVERIFQGSRRLIAGTRWLDSWLQDYRRIVGKLFPEVNALLTHIRYAFLDKNLDWQLQILAYHSALSQYHLSDDEAFPRRRGNIGWKTIDRSTSDYLSAQKPVIVFFDANSSSLYDCGGIEHGLNVRSGICVPVTWSWNGLSQAVISIDFDGLVKPTSEQIRDIFLCSHSLSDLSLGGSPLPTVPVSSKTTQGMSAWAAMLHDEFSWFAVLPDNRTDGQLGTSSNAPKNAKALLRPRERSRKTRWENRLRWLDEMSRMGITADGHIVGCPLRIGPFEAFHLVGELTDSKFSELQAKAKDEVDMCINVERAQHGAKTVPEIKKSFESIFDQPLESLFLEREIGKLFFQIARRWSTYTSLSGDFWGEVDVMFQSIHELGPDEVGLSIWDAQFKPRHRSRVKSARRQQIQHGK